MLEYFAKVVLINESQHRSLIRMDTWISNFKVKKLETHHFDIFPQNRAMRLRWWTVCTVEYFKRFNYQGRCVAQSHIAQPHQPQSPSDAAPRGCACATACEQSTAEGETSQLQVSKTRNSPSPGSLFFMSSLQFWIASLSSEELEDKQVKICILILYIFTHTSAAIHLQYRRKTKNLWHNFFGEILFSFFNVFFS